MFTVNGLALSGAGYCRLFRPRAAGAVLVQASPAVGLLTHFRSRLVLCPVVVCPACVAGERARGMSYHLAYVEGHTGLVLVELAVGLAGALELVDDGDQVVRYEICRRVRSTFVGPKGFVSGSLLPVSRVLQALSVLFCLRSPGDSVDVGEWMTSVAPVLRARLGGAA